MIMKIQIFKPYTKAPRSLGCQATPLGENFCEARSKKHSNDQFWMLPSQESTRRYWSLPTHCGARKEEQKDRATILQWNSLSPTQHSTRWLVWLLLSKQKIERASARSTQFPKWSSFGGWGRSERLRLGKRGLRRSNGETLDDCSQ